MNLWLPNDLRDPFFLGVEHSLTARPWRRRLDREGELRALALQQAHGCDETLARVLCARGVGADDYESHLAPRLRDMMPDPLTLRDMDRAVERLAEALANDETIAIFGDYDVDGAASAALLADYLASIGAKAPLIHIPDRLLEGYGPNVEAVRALASRGATLLVTVDCGTTSFEALGEARSLGLDAIVLDHHLALETGPPAIIVNPNRQDDLSGLGALCAAGVVFLTLVALTRHLRDQGFFTSARPQPDLLQSLDLVALATVADVAELVGLNRAFVSRGLMVMRGRKRIGLAALADSARLHGPVRCDHLGFLLGPRINAGGRIGDAGLGARLLTLNDEAQARDVAATLERLNGERQQIEKATLEEASALAERQLRDSNRLACLVVGGDDWHPGVMGLVASRLKDRFGLPAFAVAFMKETGAGSGRSLSGVDIGAAVHAAVRAGHIVKGGGHAMAAGVTLTRPQLSPFREFLSDRLAETVAIAGAANALRVDALLSARAVTVDFVEKIERAGPFGRGNPQPIFALAAHRVAHASEVGDGHIRARLRAEDGATLNAICFKAKGSPLGEALTCGSGAPVHVALRLSRSTFRDVERVDAQIVDLARAD